MVVRSAAYLLAGATVVLVPLHPHATCAGSGRLLLLALALFAGTAVLVGMTRRTVRYRFLPLGAAALGLLGHTFMLH